MARILQGILFLFLLSTLSLTVHAADLQAFIQEGDNPTAPEKTAKSSAINEPDTTAPQTNQAPQLTEANKQFTHIIELVVAGIVASALIISVLVLFLGRWAGRREKKLIKEIRIKAEEEQENIIAAATTVREQEKETTEIVHKIRSEAKEFGEKKEIIENFDKDVHEITLQAKAKKEVIDDISDTVTENVEKIKSYWDEQLTSTLSTIEKVQDGLDKSLSTVDKNLDDMLLQKNQSDELLSDFIAKNNEQLGVINKSSMNSNELNRILKETLKESALLLKTLKKHQKAAEKSLQKFTEELIAYEEQAYEQFDTSFQVADLARQELNANIDESRKHIETMRRHEEQSHAINTQTQKNLKSLDFSKIAKLSHTLDSTFSMFSDMTDKVDETRAMLDALNDLKADLNTDKTTSSSDSAQLASNEAPQLVKEVKIEAEKEEKAPLNPLSIDLNKPVIEAKSQAEKIKNTQEAVTGKIKTSPQQPAPSKPAVKDIIATKDEPNDVLSSLLKKEASVTKKSATDKKPKTENKPQAKEKPLAKKKPASKKAPVKTAQKEKQTAAKKARTTATKKKPTKVTTKAKAKPVAKRKTKEKAKSENKSLTTKVVPKTKKASITSNIKEKVEIKSVLDSSSKASKNKAKVPATDNKPVSFFTNVKKKKITKKDEKSAAVSGSVKRQSSGNK